MNGVTNSQYSENHYARAIESNGAIIKITVPLNTTVTIYKNNVSVYYMRPNIAYEDRTEANRLVYYYSVNSTNYGNYTVIANRDNDETSVTFAISTNTIYYVPLYFDKYYLVKNGILMPYISTTLECAVTDVAYISGTVAYVDMNDIYNQMSYSIGAKETDPSAEVVCYFNPSIDFSSEKWKTLYIDHQVRGSNTILIPCVGLTNETGTSPSTVLRYKFTPGTDGAYSARDEYNIDTSSLSDDYTIVFYYSSSSSMRGGFRIYNMCLLDS